MHLPIPLTVALATLLPATTLASPTPHSNSNHNYNTTTKAKETVPLPLIIWHGLGDTFTNPTLTALTDMVTTIHEGTYTHLIHLGDDAATDRRNTFLGNLTTQVADVCAQLAADPILRTAPAVNALGFSQGGQFLRAYVERCNAPPVRTLITFGSQHNGITKFQDCKWGDWVCRGAEALLHAGRWSAVVQGGFVPGQYFRPSEGGGVQTEESEMELYLQHSNFLADVNNERVVKNATYKENLSRLEKFVMFLFEEDGVVHPKESAWFGEVDADGEVVGVRERDIYKEDWIGLRELDEKGALVFRSVPGRHMDIGEEVLESVVREFLGPVEVDLSEDVDTHGQKLGLVVQGGY
ncbi:palmitoyl-protein thioesterase family protein [Aspergillus saccharolyticus JOP 1030-1]|uniref:Palmitoyl-protein thioesterase 1 n=1 Tax=Aspergillus saccharolyticus JOP 1030-1 TaxID=1450539 RepID=A0A318ZLW0_9EURO|nr:palmitoyl-protein thioesterase precursor [Aspergillus saccharolyticus JOP 1030-1]PYH48591.1 palmitoyl-protein thioesterase precursor [Aspergillus saccharolyticus JOP 1030-1]